MSKRWMSEEHAPGLVSVIIPTYNRAHLLIEAMDSVFAQTYRPIELIVVDDGSTDNTKEMAEEWSKRRADDDRFELRYFRQENKGAPAARNLGLIESRGEYVQFLDSDDVLHPEKLHRQTEVLRQDSGIDFVWSQTAQFRNAPSFGGPTIAGRRVEKVWPDFVKKPCWLVHSGLYRRPACVRTGPWNESLARCQDWDYGCRFLSGGPRRVHLKGVLSAARLHGAEQIRDLHHSRDGIRADIEAVRSVQGVLGARGLTTVTVRDALAARYLKIARRAGRSGWADLWEEACAAAQNSGAGAACLLQLQVSERLSRHLGLRAASWIMSLSLDSPQRLKDIYRNLAARRRRRPRREFRTERQREKTAQSRG